MHRDHPGLVRAQQKSPGGAEFAARTIGLAMNDLYNPAQLDVLRRLGRHLRQQPTEQVRTDGP
ncbi:hypothetical protein [Microlunatus soli]|uniref:hypothetical protein n=1 Tax=Microlunatus soli TaxID=630515 RepID=UPI0018D43751|nr:hypothetical protein [Microlunatus soli]